METRRSYHQAWHGEFAFCQHATCREREKGGQSAKSRARVDSRGRDKNVAHTRRLWKYVGMRMVVRVASHPPPPACASQHAHAAHRTPHACVGMARTSGVRCCSRGDARVAFIPFARSVAFIGIKQQCAPARWWWLCLDWLTCWAWTSIRSSQITQPGQVPHICPSCDMPSNCQFDVSCVQAGPHVVSNY